MLENTFAVNYTVKAKIVLLVQNVFMVIISLNNFQHFTCLM